MGVELRKKPKDLSVSETEDHGYGEGVSTEDVGESTLWYDVVCCFHDDFIPSRIKKGGSEEAKKRLSFPMSL